MDLFLILPLNSCVTLIKLLNFPELQFSLTLLCVCVLVAQLCLTLCNPTDCSPPGSSVHGILENTRVGCQALLPGIFLAQGWNTGLLHCRQMIYCLSHQGSPPLVLIPPINCMQKMESHIYISGTSANTREIRQIQMLSLRLSLPQNCRWSPLSPLFNLALMLAPSLP